MGGSLNVDNSVIVAAFHRSLLHQFLIVLAVLVILSISWNLLRTLQLRSSLALTSTDPNGAQLVTARVRSIPHEATGRRILRIGFGLLWLLDGILQAQSAMPVGLATQVIQPLRSTSPGWVTHLLNSGVLIWNNHPIQAASASVWIQVGIGLWILVAPRGRWLQAGALISVGWALVVWVFGEAFGGIFSSGLSWCFGSPGAVLIYAIAGGLIALPDRTWSTRRLGRRVLFGTGLFFIGMAVLEAWPGRGFWQGSIGHKQVGSIAAMVQAMATTNQPSALSSWATSFASFDTAHGFAVNLVIVVVLSVLGVAFCSGRASITKVAVLISAVFCLANWVLIQDFGFFGGLGTDPNSMIPMLIMIVSGYVAMVKVPAEFVELAPATSIGVWFAGLKADPAYAFRSLAAGGAVVVTLLGAAPMALASVNPNADAIVTEAVNGTPDVTNILAPTFTLTNQHGQVVSLASLRHKVVAMTFLDPVCTNDCPLIGQEFGEADRELGAAASKTVFVAIVTNPIYRSVFDMNAFDRQEQLNTLSNWLFLTGSEASLETVWNSYGVQAVVSPAGAMVDHSDIAYVIDGNGHTREVLSAAPGAGTAATKSSFAGLMDQEIRSLFSTAR
jgi:cytochrome oxidase Cu insertion factor (SCO1/SenC/PrrC family)